MILIITNSIPTKNTCIIKTLQFAPKKCKNIDSEYVYLSGIYCERMVKSINAPTYWKGVELSYTDSNGVFIETEKFTIEDFENLFKERDLELVNIEAELNNEEVVIFIKQIGIFQNIMDNNVFTININKKFDVHEECNGCSINDCDKRNISYDILKSDSLDDNEKLLQIFDLYKENLKHDYSQLYYALLAWKDSYKNNKGEE